MSWSALLWDATFWLSPTPGVAGSQGWDAALPRIATWARLRDRQSGRSFVIVNTHFDHMGETARRESARLVVARAQGLADGAPLAVTGDLNADGWEDVFIASSMNFPFRYGINTVLLNNRGQSFLDSEFILAVEPRRDRRTTAPWFELDCSGADKKNDFCENLEGRVVITGALGSRSSVIFDVDGDGDLDIVTNDFNSEPMVLISNLTEKKKIHWLKVKLICTVSNRSGLGATVTVRAGSQTYTKVRDGKSGYLSQSLYPLYFGLGDADNVREIEVLWPSGRKQVVSGPIKLNELIEIAEQ